MQIFFTENIQNNKAFFQDQEAKHISRVLRYKVGDEIKWVDGKGYQYLGSITSISKREIEVEISERIEIHNSWKKYIHIVIAPTKNMTRMEWLIEKLCEIGVDEISLIITQNSERRNIKIEKLEKKLISASKQSMKAKFATINAPISFKAFIDKINTKNLTGKYIAHCRQSIKPFVQKINDDKNAIIMIGPEGDFTQDEVTLAIDNNWIEVGLGDERLRTETAGLVACQSIHFYEQVK